MLQTAKHRTKT